MMLSVVLSGWTEVENPYEKIQSTRICVGFVVIMEGEFGRKKKKDQNLQLQSGDIMKEMAEYHV